MEQLCLQHYGVSQMETREMKTVDGGVPWWKVFRAVIAAYAVANDNCDNCLNDSIKEGADHSGSLNGGKYGGAFNY